MAVAFDAAVGSTAATWTHVNSGNAILVGVCAGTGSTDAVSAVTYGGVALHRLGFITSNQQASGGVALWGLASGSLPTGSNTVSVTGFSSWAGSVSYTGAGSLGTAVTFANNDTTIRSSGSVSVTGTTTGGMVAAVTSFGSSGTVTATSPGTKRWDEEANSNSAAGNGWHIDQASAGGGGTSTVAWTDTASDWYGMVAVEVLPPPPNTTANAGAAAVTVTANNANIIGLPVTAHAGAAAVTAAAVTAAADTGLPVITGLAGGAHGYFTDQYGKPRMVWGDAPWALCGNVGRWTSGAWQSDYDTYLTTRAGQGITVVYTKPMGTTQSGNIDSNGGTFDSLYPFQGGAPTTGTAGANPSTGLTSAYWARIDYFLNSALAKGITVFLNAIGYDSDFDGGPGPLAGKSSAEFQAYGAALGARYKNQLNLVWHLADDYYGGVDSLISAFMTGVRGAGDTHLVSIENYPETTSRLTLDGTNTQLPWGHANAQYNFVYSYEVIYYGVELAYTADGTVPVIAGDGYFYQNTNTYYAPYDRGFRQEAWWALSSGARGKISGDEGIWQWPSTAQNQASTGWWWANNAANIRAAVEALPGWQNLIPDTSSALVTSGRGTHATYTTASYEPATTDAYVTASKTPDGTLALIYLSHASTVGIATAQMSGPFTAYQIDPVTGKTTAKLAQASSYSSSGWGNNSQGDPDWVLALVVDPSDGGTGTDGGENVQVIGASTTANAGAAAVAAAAAAPAGQVTAHAGAAAVATAPASLGPSSPGLAVPGLAVPGQPSPAAPGPVPSVQPGAAAAAVTAAALPGTNSGAYRLFPSTSGPSAVVAYAGPFLAGVVFKVTQAGLWFQGYYHWVPANGDTVARKFALWALHGASAGTLVGASAVTSGTLTAGQWNFVALPVPVLLAPGTAYVACTGWTAVNGFPDSDTAGNGTGAADSFGTGGHTAGITAGPLFAFSDQGLSAPEPYGTPQGVFGTAGADPTVTMPGSGSSSANFWMDVQVSAVPPAGYTGSWRLYPNKFDANSATVADAAVDYSVATEFRLSQACVLDKIWYYSPAGTAQLATSCRIWSIQGADAGTSVAASLAPSWSGAAGSGWVSCSFSGVTLPAGSYKVSVYNGAATPDGWSAKDASTNYWGTGDGAAGFTAGPVTFPGLGTASAAYKFFGSNPGTSPPYTDGTTTEPGQCTFVNGNGDLYPYLYVDGLAQNYWVDVEVTPGVVAVPGTAGVSAAAGAPAPAVRAAPAPAPAAVTAPAPLVSAGVHPAGTDAVRGEDSGFAAVADTDAAAGADAAAVHVADTDRAAAAERELTAWPHDSDGSRLPAADSGYQSGPLSAAETARGTDGPAPVVFRMADADAAAGTDGHLIEVYTFQPPFRWTGGQYRLVLPAQHADPEIDEMRELTLWRGERPDGTALRLYAAFAAGKLHFVSGSDRGACLREEGEAASLQVTVHIAPALPVSLAVS